MSPSLFAKQRPSTGLYVTCHKTGRTTKGKSNGKRKCLGKKHGDSVQFPGSLFGLVCSRIAGQEWDTLGFLGCWTLVRVDMRGVISMPWGTMAG